MKVLMRKWFGQEDVVINSTGICPTCDQATRFVARDPWLRDHFLCESCGSIPRERALMCVIETVFPDWRQLTIHESSPSPRGASAKLASQCQHYTASQFFPDIPPGEVNNGFRCENLQAMTFADGSIDLHVSQDVLEHVFDPPAVFRETARTLKSGGAHICTVPLVNRTRPSFRRAAMNPAGEVIHLAEPVYHGNPISEKGSLVVMDWGFDIGRHVFEASGLATRMFTLDDLSRGIRAELIEVLVMYKPTDGGR